jgi:oxygen-independent coproporphyrinogen III oxidase
LPGIYIHIPFCKQACSYCDFYFVTKTDLMQEFTDALNKEIYFWIKDGVFSDGISTLYFGGGTPSRLEKKHWLQIFDALKSLLHHSKNLEITVEVNPDDITEDYLVFLKSLGVNRLSMGVQTFDPKLLQFMNRAHSVDQAKNAILLIKKVGFTSFTLDLIYGNPGQSNEDLLSDINTFLSFEPPHISAYSLTIEPRTRLGKALELGKLNPADEDLVAEQMNLIQTELEKVGYTRYEISNYAQKGHESRHNSSYWRHETYIGVGPGAHSFLWNGKDNAQRWLHPADLKAYCINPTEKIELTELTKEDLVEERFLIGLRTIAGISLKELSNRYGFELSEKQQHLLKTYEKQELLILTDSHIALSKTGMLLADRIALELISV